MSGEARVTPGFSPAASPAQPATAVADPSVAVPRPAADASGSATSAFVAPRTAATVAAEARPRHAAVSASVRPLIAVRSAAAVRAATAHIPAGSAAATSLRADAAYTGPSTWEEPDDGPATVRTRLVRDTAILLFGAAAVALVAIAVVPRSPSGAVLGATGVPGPSAATGAADAGGTIRTPAPTPTPTLAPDPGVTGSAAPDASPASPSARP